MSKAIVSWLETNAPCETATVVGPIENVEPYDPLEALLTEGAVQARRDEFHTGRRLARAALAALGCPPAVITMNDGRDPVWPPGFLGSISHTRRLCVAHVGRTRDLAGLGVDIELARELPPELIPLVCRSDEDCRLSNWRVLLCFATKEALFKSYYPKTRAFLDFHDVRVDLDEERGAFTARIVAPDKPAFHGCRVFAGRFARIDLHVVAAVWIEA